MKRTLLLFLLCGWTCLLQAQYRSGYQELFDSETVTAFKRHVLELSCEAMQGRKAGSEGERSAAAYLSAALEDAGADLLTPSGGDPFGLQVDGDTLTSCNVVGFIPGWDASLRDHYVVVGARMDNLGADTYLRDGETCHRVYYGANGNASGLAMLIELARKLSTNRVLLRRSVLLVGFGASRESFAGAWYFLHRAFPDPGHIDVMLNLDMLGTGQRGFYAYTASNADLNQVLQALREELLPLEAQRVTDEPNPGDHRVFYDREIPSILFTTGRYPEYDTDRDRADLLDYDEMEKALEYIYACCVSLCNGSRPHFRPAPSSAAPLQTVSFADCDVKPVFLTSSDPRVFLEKWVYAYLKYPSDALKSGIQGKVMVDFVIDGRGEVTDVKVTREVHPSLDEEAVRVIAASPRWRPGRHRGRKVCVRLSLPVEFRLEKKTKNK